MTDEHNLVGHVVYVVVHTPNWGTRQNHEGVERHGPYGYKDAAERRHREIVQRHGYGVLDPNETYDDGVGVPSDIPQVVIETQIILG